MFSFYIIITTATSRPPLCMVLPIYLTLALILNQVTETTREMGNNVNLL